jgi:hypothetical protein
MPMDSYRELREDPTLFAIVPGHELPDVEDVVEERDAYSIVRKHEGDPAEIARDLR